MALETGKFINHHHVIIELRVVDEPVNVLSVDDVEVGRFFQGSKAFLDRTDNNAVLPRF